MKTLPKYLMITGSDPKLKDKFIEKLISHINNGIKLIQLRAKELNNEEYVSLAEIAIEIGRKFGAKIILNSNIETAKALNADGVHLTSDILMECYERPLHRNTLISAACHNSEQLKHAELIGVDFVTLSPVCRTKTHPDAIPLGWPHFSELCKSINMPVYALGGITESDLDVAISNGAYGIASISSLWDNPQRFF